jgi:CNT family concentrative nucleoside transporter
MVAIAWIASTQRRNVDWRSVGIAFLLQLAIAFLFLRTGVGEVLFSRLNDAAVAFIAAADRGIDFVFGRWPPRVMGEAGQPIDLPFVFAVRVLPVIIFMSSVFSVLYHFGALQLVVEVLARGLRRVLPISGAEALSTVANIFLGMTEAPLMVRPYVEGMTRSELFLVMVAGLASVAGSVLVAYMGMVGPEYAEHLIAASFMSAPAAIMYSKLMIPEDGKPATGGDMHVPPVPRTSVNAIDAAAEGASEGLRLALNIGAMLIAFVALIYLLDALLASVGGWLGVADLSFGKLLGWTLSPVA